MEDLGWVRRNLIRGENLMWRCLEEKTNFLSVSSFNLYIIEY